MRQLTVLQQVVVSALVKAVPGLWSVLVLLSLFWLVFAILGVSLFKGGARSCDIDAALDQPQCEAAGGTWTRHPNFSFDSTHPAYGTQQQPATV